MENESVIVPELANADYHAHKAIGSSGIKLIINKSPRHYWAQYIAPDRLRKPSTAAQAFGTAWHCAIFEPERFNEEYAQVPLGLDRRTKEGKALWAEIEASGKTALAYDAFQDIAMMVKLAGIDDEVAKIFKLETGIAEHSMFCTDKETGVHLKIRPDFAVLPCAEFPNGLIVDGKTCGDASPAGFGCNMWNTDMALQAALYVDVFQQVIGTQQPPEFRWLAQETEVPFAHAMYSATDDLIEYGRKMYSNALPLIAECQSTDIWPGYKNGTIQIPAYALRSISPEDNEELEIKYA